MSIIYKLFKCKIEADPVFPTLRALEPFSTDTFYSSIVVRKKSKKKEEKTFLFVWGVIKSTRKTEKVNPSCFGGGNTYHHKIS